MTPDADEVRALLVFCLFRDDEPREPRVEAQGVIHTFHFHPARIAAKRSEIAEQLAGLPDEFMLA
jgi:hypothetical protein